MYTVAGKSCPYPRPEKIVSRRPEHGCRQQARTGKGVGLARWARGRLMLNLLSARVTDQMVVHSHFHMRFSLAGDSFRLLFEEYVFLFDF